MTNDLVKRLRWSADGWDAWDEPDNAEQDREAADRIEELTAENARLREALTRITMHWDRQFMQDSLEKACRHAIETSSAALSPPAQEQRK